MQDRARPASLDPATDESGLVKAVELEDPNAVVADEATTGVLTPEFVSGTLISAGVLIATIVLLRNLRKVQRRRANQPDETPAERLSEIRATAAREGAHELHAARAAEVARHYVTLIDNKIEHLEQVITEAEHAIARLEDATQRAADHEFAPDAQDQVPAGDEPQPPLPNTPTLAEPDATPEPAPASPAQNVDPVRARVFELADQGVTPVEIARQVGTHTGKVELILALRNAAG